MLNTLLLASAMMSIGWALRGSIGGGPLGAMIPGALWAMAIARRGQWSFERASLFIGLAALGVGLGGQETYGQTIGLLREPTTRLWGLLGLAVKGAVWGLLAGVMMTLAWKRPKRPLTIALILIVATQIGWQFINQPKLIYFSNRQIAPREEIWAGLLLSGLALMALQQSYRLPLLGALGGAAGFGVGSLWNLVPVADFPGWKCMEFTFGAILGATLAFAIATEDPPQPSFESRWVSLLAIPFAILGVASTLYLQLRFSFTATVALLLLGLLRWPQSGWPLSLAMTLGAACFGLYPKHPYWAIALGITPAAFIAWPQLYKNCALPLLLLACCWIYCLEYLPIFR